MPSFHDNVKAFVETPSSEHGNAKDAYVSGFRASWLFPHHRVGKNFFHHAPWITMDDSLAVLSSPGDGGSRLAVGISSCSGHGPSLDKEKVGLLFDPGTICAS